MTSTATPKASRMRYTNMTASHKVAVGGGVGGAASVVLVWCLQTFAQVPVPTEVGMAFGTLIMTALAVFIPTAKE